MKQRNGLDLIKKSEGCRLQAYRCPAGIWTIGWGRTTHVREGDKCSQAQADAWLEGEYDQFEAGVLKLVKVPLNANQLGALVSFAYNLGLGALKSSTLLRLVNQGQMTAAADQFLRWDKAGGRVLPGLTKRRAAERELFLRAA